MLDLLKKRRSVRHYLDKPVEEHLLEQVLQAGLLAPSSKNRKPWEFVLLKDRAVLQAMKNCRKPEQAFLPQAAAAIVVVGHPEISDVWIEDCSIAMVLMHLEAVHLGLGSCWVQIRNRDSNQEGITSEAYIKSLCGIPSEYSVLAILSLGYAAEDKAPHAEQQMDQQKIHRERFGMGGDVPCSF